MALTEGEMAASYPLTTPLHGLAAGMVGGYLNQLGAQVRVVTIGERQYTAVLGLCIEGGGPDGGPVWVYVAVLAPD